MVTEVGQVIDPFVSETSVVRHGLERGAQPFAIATGVADPKHPPRLCCGIGRNNVQLHIAALEPAMRPNTPPMVMPEPAQ